MTWIDSLHPVERGGGITNFANATIVAALAAADAAKVKSHHGATKLLKGLVHRISDAVVHGSAVQRMRMQDQCDRRP